MKALEKCRAAYEQVYSFLPPQVTAMIRGAERKQDAVIAEVYGGKITFGEFNVAMNQLNGELSAALSGVSTSTAANAQKSQQDALSLTAPLSQG
jgi:hypothetical protein